MSWKFLIIPTTLILLAIPLIRRKVPPNPTYGFRTPKTLSDRRIWYEANYGAGWDLIFAGVAQILLVVMRPYIPALAELPPGRFVLLVELPILILAVAHSFWRLRRL